MILSIIVMIHVKNDTDILLWIHRIDDVFTLFDKRPWQHKVYVP